MLLSENVLFKKKNAIKSIFQKISGYTNVKVTEEELYLAKWIKTLWDLTCFIKNNTFRMEKNLMVAKYSWLIVYIYIYIYIYISVIWIIKHWQFFSIYLYQNIFVYLSVYVYISKWVNLSASIFVLNLWKSSMLQLVFILLCVFTITFACVCDLYMCHFSYLIH